MNQKIDRCSDCDCSKRCDDVSETLPVTRTELEVGGKVLFLTGGDLSEEDLESIHLALRPLGLAAFVYLGNTNVPEVKEIDEAVEYLQKLKERK